MALKEVLELLAALVTVIAAIYGVSMFIDSRIEKKIKDSEFLRRLATSFRPTVIIAETGSVLVDHGAMEILENIEVHHAQDGLPSQVILTPRRHLPYPPLLQALDNEMIQFTANRGKKFAWVIDLDYVMHSDEFDGKRRFRIELLV